MDPVGLLDPLSNLFPDWVKPFFVLWFAWGILVYWTLMHKGDGRERWFHQINGGLADAYRLKLGKVLDWTSKHWFKDQAQVDQSRHKPHLSWLGVNTFTEPAFILTLSLALLYPIISLILFWTLSGKGGIVGSLVVLKSDAEAWQRWLFLLSLLLATGLTYKAVSSKHWASTIYIIVAVAVIVAVIVAGAFTVAGTVAIVWFIDWSYRLAQRKSYTHWFWLGFISLYFLIALAAIDWFAGILAPTQAINSQLLLFFYVLLPIVNAIWDWLSLGVTRSLLYAIVDKVHSGWRAFLWALMDGVLALIFLFFITLTTTATIALMNRISILGGGSAIVDLAWVFDSLRFEARDPDHWWLYFMFFSTLIPTVAHMVIASLSVLLWIPRHTLE